MEKSYSKKFTKPRHQLVKKSLWSFSFPTKVASNSNRKHKLRRQNQKEEESKSKKKKKYTINLYTIHFFRQDLVFCLGSKKKISLQQNDPNNERLLKSSSISTTLVLFSLTFSIFPLFHSQKRKKTFHLCCYFVPSSPISSLWCSNLMWEFSFALFFFFFDEKKKLIKDFFFLLLWFLVFLRFFFFFSS